MKKIIIPILFASAALIVCPAGNTFGAIPSATQDNQPEMKTGKIVELNSNGGKIVDYNSGMYYEFTHPRAEVNFSLGDNVSYIKITLPNGNVIVNEVRKPN